MKTPPALIRFDIAHHIGDEIEHTQWWAEDAKHALEQWQDYAKDIGPGVVFHSMTVYNNKSEG